jgi:hypothetical protein
MLVRNARAPDHHAGNCSGYPDNHKTQKVGCKRDIPRDTCSSTDQYYIKAMLENTTEGPRRYKYKEGNKI